MALITNDELAKARRAERRKLRRARRKAEEAGLDPSSVKVDQRFAKKNVQLAEKDSFNEQVITVLKERFPTTLTDPEDHYWYSFSTDLCRDLTPDDAVDAMLERLRVVGVELKNWVILSGHIIGFGPNTES